MSDLMQFFNGWHQHLIRLKGETELDMPKMVVLCIFIVFTLAYCNCHHYEYFISIFARGGLQTQGEKQKI